MPHMTKVLRRAITLRTVLKYIANKAKSEEDIRKYRDQRILVVKLDRKSRREYFKSIQSKSTEMIKNFRKL